MSEQVDRWNELDEALLELGEGTMVLEELDGFIAGVLVCPETIPPGEWFARAVGLSKSQPSPFADIEHANDVLDLVMDYHDAVAATLQRDPEHYQPRFSIDDNSGDVLWELWIDGFAAATDLRRRAFDVYREIGGEAETAATGMVNLIDAAVDGDTASDEFAKLSSRAPENIRDFVVTLHRCRQGIGFTDRPNPFASTPKIGRNDPCPCGSGRKYKRCCGAN